MGPPRTSASPGSTVHRSLSGPHSTTTGLHEVICLQEVVLPTAAAIYKGLAEPRLRVVEVPDLPGPAETRVQRLQAESRPRGLGRALVFTPWGAGHQGGQEDEKSCRETEPAHLHGLAEGFLF